MNSKAIFRTLGLMTIALVLFSCKKTVKEQDSDLIEITDAVIVPQEFSYKYSKNKDEISLFFTRSGDSLIGKLEYHLNEKDQNIGTIKGIIKNDVLIADYDFMSEGIKSTRQVVFKMEDDSLLEGYGDVIEKDGKVVFADPNQLKYNEDFKLNLVK
ncbi:hypothetical protein [Flavobacterium sp. NKUCC04_CG]|uniref:hypothetical protein n=1 Tax=Flavobacterium sp. NKUCC04_CG TaxID=2842121 RepID=UPI001C5A81A2|nr:hypothetical protein [Flavobacterium sp. NKUCC04_CG]MBW3519647.1 hypothetical protein [Flavobacterium sp. NKUCC04_CG]